MCGIVGYIGKREAYPILIKGLKRLEYRGYDSAGVALISNSGDLNVYKAKGKVSDLERSVEAKDVSGHIGIAHTRWATLGRRGHRRHPSRRRAEGGGYGQHAHAPYGENGGHQSWPTGKGRLSVFHAQGDFRAAGLPA